MGDSMRAFVLAAVLLWAVPVSAQEPSRFGNHFANAMVAAQLTTTVVDYGVTLRAVDMGLQEGHPLWRPLQHKPVVFGIAKIGIGASTTYGLSRLPRREWKKKLLIASAITAINVWAISHNAKAMRDR